MDDYSDSDILSLETSSQIDLVYYTDPKSEGEFGDYDGQVAADIQDTAAGGTGTCIAACYSLILRRSV